MNITININKYTFISFSAVLFLIFYPVLIFPLLWLGIGYYGYRTAISTDKLVEQSFGPMITFSACGPVLVITGLFVDKEYRKKMARHFKPIVSNRYYYLRNPVVFNKIVQHETTSRANEILPNKEYYEKESNIGEKQNFYNPRYYPYH